MLPDKSSIIHCIGDSHVDFFSGQDTVQRGWPIPSNDMIPFFKTYCIGPVLAYNLCKEKARTKGREILFFILETIPHGSSILLCFGEIDCRAHLLKQCANQQRDLESIVRECTNRYFGVIQEIKAMGYRPIVWNVIPSTMRTDLYSSGFPVSGTCLERNQVAMLFNQCLRILCGLAEILFISIFDKLVDESGLTRTDYYRKDGQHLSQKAMPLALREFNKIGIISEKAANER